MRRRMICGTLLAAALFTLDTETGLCLQVERVDIR